MRQIASLCLMNLIAMCVTGCLVVGLPPLVAHGQSPQLIAPTEPLTPQEQKQKFRLPPGFEIQLVVANPDIGQPMNLNFDSRGRLWITHSVEYPYPVDVPGLQARDPRFGQPAKHAPRDRLTVVSGIGSDGRPRSIQHFGQKLNIPIGQLPLNDRAIVFSIPDIYTLKDTDGDGTADQKTVLYGRFGNVDTHGMASSFTRWLDGWVYGCHGFRNESRIVDGRNRVTKLNSGNTYRFQVDGSQFQQWTWGQVNPYGLTFDEWGNLYSADCHSKPLTCLIRGAYYSSFGKPHDGLGFGPDMIDHSHGSTGICGPAYYSADHFPKDYRGNLFLCNPVTGRVHRDKLIWQGSSPQVRTQPDFVACDDAWFRPVDAKLGPDGALYLADFYNCIIGHYEVPLDHPRRDRTHGRVWRIVYRGNNESGRFPTPPDLHSLNTTELAKKLGDSNLLVRTLATHELVDCDDPRGVSIIRGLLKQSPSAEFRQHAFWVLLRKQALEIKELAQWASDPDPRVRAHLAIALGESFLYADQPLQPIQRQQWLNKLLSDENPFVVRMAAQSVQQHPASDTLPHVLRAFHRVLPQDTHCRHALRIALKKLLQVDSIAKHAVLKMKEPGDLELLGKIALAVPTPAAAEIVARQLQLQLQHLQSSGMPLGEASFPLIEYLAKFQPSIFNDSQLIDQLRSCIQNQQARETQTLLAIARGMHAAPRASLENSKLQAWALDRMRTELNHRSTRMDWRALSIAGQSLPARAWKVGQRTSTAGQTLLLHSSFPLGEQAVGQWVSSSFDLPEQFAFWIAGHRGPPNQAAHQKNWIELRDARTHATIQRAYPPRNDVAQQRIWDLSSYKKRNPQSRQGYVVINDADTHHSYAWLAVGQFELDELNPVPDREDDRLPELVKAYWSQEIESYLRTTIADSSVAISRRVLAAECLLAGNSAATLAALIKQGLHEPASHQSLKFKILKLAAQFPNVSQDAVKQVLQQLFSLLPAAGRQRVATTLAGDAQGLEVLLHLVEQGSVPARLLTLPSIEEACQIRPADNLLRQRREKLIKELPPLNQAIEQFIAKQQANFVKANASVTRGRVVFKKHCAACHRVGKEGSVVGPQLDGIGLRGANRLLEDIFDPNRNVDLAFRVTTLARTDGRVQTGLLRRREDGQEVYVDNQGKEFSVPTSEIAARRRSNRSLMPANLHETVPTADIPHLLKFLLNEQRVIPSQDQ